MIRYILSPVEETDRGAQAAEEYVAKAYRAVFTESSEQNQLVPLLSPDASQAWDELVRRAKELNSAFAPPPKPAASLLQLEDSQETSVLAHLMKNGGLRFEKEPTIDPPQKDYAFDLTQPESFRARAFEQGYLLQLGAARSLQLGGGRNCTATILDEGFFFEHSDFPASVRASALAFGDHNPKGLEHGTNVLGIMAMQHNNIFGEGIVPNAAFRLGSYFQAQGTPILSLVSRLTLAGHAPTNSHVVVLPIQHRGKPLESDRYCSQALQLIVAAGTHVVAAAGNGNLALQESHFPTPSPGTILVGAGWGNGTRFESSNYGDRVNWFAQGFGVYTTSVNIDAQGLATAAAKETFSHTSAATALIASLVCAIQGAKPLSPLKMQAALGIGGFACSNGARIGTRPNLEDICNFLQL